MNQNPNFSKTNEQSLLVGKRVVYSITKDTFSRGLVLDKSDIREKPSDTFTVTGYMIQDEETNEIAPVAYWRVKKICTEAPVKGGYNRQTHNEH